MTDKTVTKEGIRVEVGQVWRDLDPRAVSRGRVVTITRVDSNNGFAFYEKPKKGRISIRRMHKASTGFQLVQP